MKEPMKTRLHCLVLAALSAACQRVDRSAPAGEGRVMSDTTAPPASPAAPTPSPAPPTPVATKVAVVEGFLTPESVKYDTAQDVYFVSNVNGGPLAKDNNGFISRVRPDGAIENLKFVEGAHNGVPLNAPKGLALRAGVEARGEGAERDRQGPGRIRRRRDRRQPAPGLELGGFDGVQLRDRPGGEGHHRRAESGRYRLRREAEASLGADLHREPGRDLAAALAAIPRARP